VSGWRDGDPVAARNFAELGAISLEFGEVLPSARVAYETFGTPQRNARGVITNAVLVLHALTGDAHVAGAPGPGQPTPGWWDGVVGPGRALDTTDWFVVSSNVLGGCQGTTGPWSSLHFPRITIRDQVHVEALLASQLGIDRYVAVLGGSMGGMRALEWPLLYPSRVGAALVLAVGACATGDQIGTQTTQMAAIRADPVHGLGLARRIAHLTYRSELELDTRFGRALQDDGRYAAQSYLEHHAAKLEARFDAGSYVALTDAMNTHHVGRGRGGVAAALASIRIPMVVGGISSDRLYPLRLQHEIAQHLPNCDGVRVVESPYGHDGFLIETDAVGDLVRETLARARQSHAEVA
jgi:homoserine O-acetyltransferase